MRPNCLVSAELLRQPQRGEEGLASIPPTGTSRAPLSLSLPILHASRPLVSTGWQHHRALCQFPNAAMKNDRKLRGVNNANVLSYRSGGHKSGMGPTANVGSSYQRLLR